MWLLYIIILCFIDLIRLIYFKIIQWLDNNNNVKKLKFKKHISKFDDLLSLEELLDD